MLIQAQRRPREALRAKIVDFLVVLQGKRHFDQKNVAKTLVLATFAKKMCVFSVNREEGDLRS